MGKIISGILIISLLIFLTSSREIDDGQCFIENNAFEDGEVLVYKLYYNWKMVWIPAGEVKFTVKENQHDYEYFAEGKTYSSYDNFFKVRDYYYSKVNKSTLYPENFVRNIEEGKYFRYDSIVFNQEDEKAISYWGSKPSNARPFEFELDGCMQDMLSILYYVRNYDFESIGEGEKVPVSVFFDKEVYPLKVTYDGKEKKKKIKNLGQFNTMKFIPEVVAGYVFDEKTTMTLWVSDDKNKIPLQIESPVSIGSIKAVLKRHANLKYPLSSQISK